MNTCGGLTIKVSRYCHHEGKETLHRLVRAEWTTIRSIHKDPVLVNGSEVRVFVREYACTECKNTPTTAVADFGDLTDMASELASLRRKVEILSVEVRRLVESVERMTKQPPAKRTTKGRPR